MAFNRKEFIKKEGALVAFIFLFLLASILYEPFLSARNITNILRQMSMLGIMAIGMTGKTFVKKTY